tara:strand:+ start:1433 stop:2077 length:645 start_codon:yes stop_codon:yes gene_type:complete
MAIKLTIPESLNEITLGQYQKWLKITDGKEMNTFYQQKMIEIFCKTRLIDALRMKVTDINKITFDLNKIFEDKPAFKDRFRMNEKEFGFIPKLDDMTFGEYVDLDNYLNEWETMDKAMGVLFRPISFKRKGQYRIEEYETASKYNMKNMPLDIVMASLLFFWNLKKELLKHIVNYLQNQQEVNLPPHLIASLKNGVGINPFTDSVREILETYQK